jgi:apoptosis-inducing factor 3
MAGHDGNLSGPDLAAGVAADELAPGASLLGHAHGESVLLARVGNEFLAIGATCTHYGGPLAEGVIDGDTVRCPWHHACFSLRNGEALRAPALSPVPCYRVERRGDRVIVAGKEERDPLASTYPAANPPRVTPRNVVIVGAGAAGSAAAEMLRRCGYTGNVTIVDEEPRSPYDRPNLSKDYLAGTASEDWIPLRDAAFYQQQSIDLRLATRAVAIDTQQRLVRTSNGDSLAYGALLIATGAEPIRLDLPGADLPHVHYLRSLADSRSLIDAAGRARRVVVIGASFIGLEVAASLRNRQLEVDVVAPDRIPMERVMGSEIGTLVRSIHEEHGVRFHLLDKVRSISAHQVQLESGTTIDADLVVVGIGVRPALELAESAGLALDRGISVNQYLETSVAGIFAAGDIARWPDPHTGQNIRVEHWVVAERQGQAAALNMLGRRQAFDAVPFFWSMHYDMSISYVGHAERWDSLAIDGAVDQRDCRVAFVRSGRTLAVATISRDLDSLRAERELELMRV